LGPCGERPLASRYSIFEVLLGSNRNVPELFASGGVDSMMDLLTSALFAVYDVVEGREIDIGGLEGRHVA